LIKKEREENKHCTLNRFLRESFQNQKLQNEAPPKKPSQGKIRPKTSKVSKTKNAITGEAGEYEINADIRSGDNKSSNSRLDLKTGNTNISVSNKS
jgi:hypothetical protein